MILLISFKTDFEILQNIFSGTNLSLDDEIFAADISSSMRDAPLLTQIPKYFAQISMCTGAGQGKRWQQNRKRFALQ